MESPLIAYLGDDFNGAVDVLELLQWSGLQSALFLDVPTEAQLARFNQLRAVGVVTSSRTMTPAEMEQELPPIFAGLAALNPRYLHYKTGSTGDSSQRVGSIGKALELGRVVCQSGRVPMLIAAPRWGHYQTFGHLFATGGDQGRIYRLDRHPTLRYHPLTPMYEADVREHLKLQTSLKIDLVHCAQLNELSPPEWMLDGEVVLFDAVSASHLTRFAEYCEGLSRVDKPILLVGSSGIEHALIDYWNGAGQMTTLQSHPAAEPVLAETSQLLVLSASCSPVNERQALWAQQAGFEAVAIEPAFLIEPSTSDAEFNRVVDLAVEKLGSGAHVLMHSVLGLQDRRRNQLMNAYAALGLGQEEVQLENSRRLGPILGRIMAEVLARHRVPRIAISGGDTASYVTRQLKIEAITAEAAIIAGVPLCKALANNAFNGLEMIFKPGQLGDQHFWKTARGGTGQSAA